MDLDEIAALVGSDFGIFVGGTTEWKEANLLKLGAIARAKGARLHAGRVNTARRIALCAAAGADSFDVSSVSRFVKTLPLFENARQQRDLFACTK